ncbi:MAG: hypothetical protein GX351_06735 [Peptococcaceae bacterium]|jgi:nucleoside-triphosphatase|nr:hypothetical protein [Peptococcaceae bacterium]
MPNNLFLTGRIRSGKSTLLKEVVDPIKNQTGGFFVQRLFVGGESRAFRLVDIAVEDYWPNREVQALDSFADLIALSGEKRMVYPDVFRTVGVSALKQAAATKRLVLMDELGRLELKVPEFIETVLATLDREMPVLGVLKKESNSFLDQIKGRPDVTVLDLDVWDRYKVKEKIQEFVKDNFKPE